MHRFKNAVSTSGGVLSLLEAAYRWGPMLITVIGSSSVSAWSVALSEPFTKFAPFSWIAAAILGAILGVILVWIWAAAKQKLGYAALLKKAAEDSDRINILENSFNRQMIKLSDFSLPIPTPHKHKIFNECFLIGPANIVCLDTLTLTNGQYINCDYVVLNDHAQIFNAISFENLTITGGVVTGVTFLLPKNAAASLPPHVNWITNAPK
ncbi:hypothetical protein Q9R35_00940 [Alcaligenes sp. AB3]|uniref:hypothetical protein n=1 Tax=Alcaligenes sp. AB3 TaxID=2962569 RepID=UPI0028814B44|nr:hypothetical protein [Alcaligenes sp. AB3]MDT0215877.1 hypothetical protein [Alcaligenes sp. AB3]